MNDTDFKNLPRKKPEKVDHLPPNSIEAEQGVLGCMMMSPESCISEAQGRMLAGPEVFYDLRHQTLFQCLIEMWDEKVRIDLVTIQQRLKDAGKLDGVGGLAYIASLPDLVISAAGMSQYIDIVLEKYLLRKMIQICTATVGNVFNDESDPQGLAREFEKMARIIGDEAIRLGGEARKSTAAFAQSAIDDWEWSYKNQGEYSGIPSGLVDVDRIMWGFQKQDLILVGGRPSTGKSSLVIQFAAHAAIDLKKPTLVFSLETTGKAVVKRIACQRAQVSQTVLRSGRETREDMDKIAIQVGKITHSPLYIVDTKKLRISQVEGIARQYKEQYGIEMVVVDYLQKVYPDRQHEKRTYEVSQVAEGLKSMAEDNDVPVVVAAQLNRESDKGGKGGTPRQPRLSDFADSGKIEQEADAAILLHHDGDKSWLLIPKVRDGETNMVPVKFNKQWTRFDSASFPTKFDIPKENTNYDNE